MAYPVVDPNFVKLDVYAAAASLAADLRVRVRTWDVLDRWTVGIQGIRAADSIGANIAEAEGRWGLADRLRLLVIARGSAFELQHWLRATAAAGLPLPDNAVDRAAKTAAMLNNLTASMRRRAT